MTTWTGETHPCPIRYPAPGCPRSVPDHLLMCGIHWRLCPRAFQTAVNAAWQGGRGKGTAALRAAQRAAIDAVNNRLADTRTE